MSANEINPKYPNLIAPSYIKTYVTPYSDGTKIAELWAKSIQAIRCSSRVVIIGYSLPESDSAAMTLFLGITGKTVEVVNPCLSLRKHIHDLLYSHNQFGKNSTDNVLFDRIHKYYLSDWLNEHEADTAPQS